MTYKNLQTLLRNPFYSGLIQNSVKPTHVSITAGSVTYTCRGLSLEQFQWQLPILAIVQ